MTRTEHLQWAKDRARAYTERGDAMTAWQRFVRDLNKHGGLREHTGLQLGIMLLLDGHNRTPDEMQKFIEGFN